MKRKKSSRQNISLSSMQEEKMTLRPRVKCLEKFFKTKCDLAGKIFPAVREGTRGIV